MPETMRCLVIVFVVFSASMDEEIAAEKSKTAEKKSTFGLSVVTATTSLWRNGGSGSPTPGKNNISVIERLTSNRQASLSAMTTSTSRAEDKSLGYDEAKQTILIGVCAVMMIAFMFCFSRIRNAIRSCKEAEKDSLEDIEADQPEKETEAEDTVYVQYNLGEEKQDVKTVSRIVALLSSGSNERTKSYNKRSASSYRRSFRVFKKQREEAEAVGDHSLPTYRDVTKLSISEIDLPPLYWELSHNRAGPSGAVNGAFAPCSSKEKTDIAGDEETGDAPIYNKAAGQTELASESVTEATVVHREHQVV